MTDLATRIEAAYMQRTGAASPRGARLWFAREARVCPEHLSRVLGGARALSGRVLMALDYLERRGGS